MCPSPFDRGPVAVWKASEIPCHIPAAIRAIDPASPDSQPTNIAHAALIVSRAALNPALMSFQCLTMQRGDGDRAEQDRRAAAASSLLIQFHTSRTTAFMPPDGVPVAVDQVGVRRRARPGRSADDQQHRGPGGPAPSSAAGDGPLGRGGGRPSRLRQRSWAVFAAFISADPSVRPDDGARRSVIAGPYFWPIDAADPRIAFEPVIFPVNVSAAAAAWPSSFATRVSTALPCPARVSWRRPGRRQVLVGGRRLGWRRSGHRLFGVAQLDGLADGQLLFAGVDRLDVGQRAFGVGEGVVGRLGAWWWSRAPLWRRPVFRR